jgi:hypothetical protein
VTTLRDRFVLRTGQSHPPRFDAGISTNGGGFTIGNTWPLPEPVSDRHAAVNLSLGCVKCQIDADAILAADQQRCASPEVIMESADVNHRWRVALQTGCVTDGWQLRCAPGVLDASAERPTAGRSDLPGALSVSVVLPCLNEASSVGPCVEEARTALEKAGISGEVVVRVAIQSRLPLAAQGSLPSAPFRAQEASPLAPPRSGQARGARSV